MSEETKKSPFPLANDSSNTILMEWWQGLEKDRGARAALRRAANQTEVVFLPVYHRLLNKLLAEGYKVNRDSLALVCGLTAHIKESVDNESIATQMAKPKPGGEKALVSGLRFRRILAITERDELYSPILRILRMLDGKANLSSLANSIYWWNENTRKQWAYDYYAQAPSED